MAITAQIRKGWAQNLGLLCNTSESVIYVTIFIVLLRNGGNSVKKPTFRPIFRRFWFAPFYALRVTTNFWSNKRSHRDTYSWLSFIIIQFLVVKLYTFKCFRRSRKYNFWLLLGGFSRITPPNDEVEFVPDFRQWCIAR